MKIFIIIVILLLISVGIFLLWWLVFNQSTEEQGVSPQTKQPPAPSILTWERLEDFLDGYTIEYPVGSQWSSPSHSTHALQIPSGIPREPNYFTLSVTITSDQNEQLRIATAARTKPNTQIELVTFQGQNAVRIVAPENITYLFAHNSAVWTIQQPMLSDPQKIQIADRILNSFTILNPQQVTQSILLRDGTPESATNEQIVQMKLRDSTRKKNLQTIRYTLKKYFEAHGHYPVAPTEDKIYEGKQSFSFLHTALSDESEAYIMYAGIPGDPKEDFYYRYLSPDGTSYLLTAQLEQGKEADCDRSLSQQICLYAVRP